MEDSSSPIAAFSDEKHTRTCIQYGIPCRYSMAILGCLGFGVVYALRVNLSIALVAMVNSTSSGSSLNSFSRGYEDKVFPGVLKASQEGEEFHWTRETQGIILSSFFYGYFVTQLPGGWMASRFGGKHLFGLGVLCTSVFTLLTPWAAGKGIWTLVAVRVLEGIGEGVTFPAMQVLFSSWAPPLERSRMMAVAYTGCGLGNIIAQLASGYLCASDFLGGWPSVFYIFGALGIVWYFSWIVLVFEKPATHPRISEEEKAYILSAIGSSQDQVVKNLRIPWLAICKSPAVYAVILAFFCSNWGYYTFLTALPSYFKDVLGMKILEDGFMSSIPYAVNLLFQFSAVLADWLITVKICTVTEVRKLAVVAAFVIPACLLVSTSYIGSEGKTLAIVLISLAVGFGGFNAAGQSVCVLDVAPRFAGLLMGIANSFGSISGFTSPLVTGWLTNDKPSRAQWQKVFYLSASIYVIGAIGFVILGSCEEQPWNTPEDELLLEVDIDREPRTPLVYSSHHCTQQYQSINRVQSLGSIIL